MSHELMKPIKPPGSKDSEPTNYYILDCFPGDNTARILPPRLDTKIDNWRTGHPLEVAPPSPMRYTIEEGDEGELLPYIKHAAPLMSIELLDALRSMGADNIAAYDASIREVRTGREHGSHAAINIIGLVACADLSRSDYIETGLSMFFSKLVVDEARTQDLPLLRLAEHPSSVLVHDRVKQALQKLPVGTRLDFRHPATI